ncbi:MAG: 2-polyprenyl-3-methyl-5-hydroxy-6-metoxy-1,4-benzoquinol methylase [Acidobacteria bacterium]|nr:MAG: 2-polyprenyl-3-methyl-5-hydroxy-6-metoxy-1,4-benzoquinol methylase [Acidobacteriota bacterium]
MDDFRELLACPACAGTLAADWSCCGCGARYDVLDGIAALRLPCDDRTDAVRRFYERAPFPGYPPHDSLHALRARAERSPFPRLIDRAIPGDARIVDVGCGTGQMCLFLARADRVIVGADMTRESLRLAAAAAQRFRVDRVQFVETDLQRPGLKRGAFDVVYSSGVLHHTPDPRASFARLAQLARPGGTIVLGVYNAFARLPARLRRVAARLSGDRLVAFDAVLRERQYEPARRDAWLRDQYQHPEEHSHTLSEVQGWFAENGVEYLRAYPSALLDGEPEDLFARAPDNWLLEGWLAQLEWIWTLGREGGLFFTIGRRASCARP